MGQKNTRSGDVRTPEEKARSREIDEAMVRAREADQEVIKLLLLGAGESGKSTLFKQMVKLYGKGFSTKEYLLHIPMIHNNVVTGMKELCLQTTLSKPIEDPAAQNSCAVLTEMKSEEKITPEIAHHITRLWKDPSIQAAYQRRNEFQLVDCIDFFFNDVDRLAAPDFLPNDTDLIRCRVRTTGIVERHFVIDENKFLLVDVGGQRNERKKWIHCFDGVTAVIFIVAISGYNQTLYEDGRTNRMEEALKLFSETCALQWFASTSFILFLNKRDLFAERIATQPLTVWERAKEGEVAGELLNPNDNDECIEFIRQVFKKAYTLPKLYIHVTTATDTSNIAMVFGAVKDIIIQSHLQESGLI